MRHTDKNDIPKSEREHILVCLSSAPSNAKIVRTGAMMARAFNAEFTALFVKTPDYDALDEENRKRLEDNTRLAEELGAVITTVFGEDVSHRIAEFARLSGVTKVIIGRSGATKKRLIGMPSLTERLIEAAPKLDIYIIPDQISNQKFKNEPDGIKKRSLLGVLRDAAVTVGILAGATALGLGFSALGFTEANIITVYILGVLLSAVMTESKLMHALASVLGVLVFNFLFTAPHFSFLAYDDGYPITSAIMLAASLLTGSLAARMKSHARESAMTSYRTRILFETNQLIAKAKTENEILSATAGQIIKLLGCGISIFLYTESSFSAPISFSGNEKSNGDMPSEKLIRKCFEKGIRVGASTDTDPECGYLLIPIKMNKQSFGVIAMHVSDRSPDSFENGILTSVIGECALALENLKNQREKHEADLRAKNQELRANLLRTISHDLRTPLTSISGNADNLMSNGEKFDENTKRQIYSDIYDDSMWLYNLVENLLSVTRIEEGKMNLRLSSELCDEVISEALKHVSKRRNTCKISTDFGDDILLCRMDARLIMQVIINLVDNALKYAGEGSEIIIKARKNEGKISVSVADTGSGIPDEAKDKVFEMFYTGGGQTADCRRSMGLGLALCKAIIIAHGGGIFVSDNTPHGAVFTFTIPTGEVQIHE